jgi:hypothetical protein
MVFPDELLLGRNAWSGRQFRPMQDKIDPLPDLS